MADDYGMMDDFTTTTTRPGRGWHGDSEGHARAGRKGGKAKRKKSSPSRSRR